jgi:isoquinoline 1-oxidoreductase alpha subunit
MPGKVNTGMFTDREIIIVFDNLRGAPVARDSACEAQPLRRLAWLRPVTHAHCLLRCSVAPSPMRLYDSLPNQEWETFVITLSVNGKKANADVAPDTPLLWVLRDTLGMTGTKFGCGMALCGACTVHLDGKPVRSCSTPVSDAAGKKITTIEAMAADAVGKAVQAAWIKHDVPQCGYCQSGQIMSASALLAQNKKPSDADIDAAMSGNICRCGTYNQIRAAIKDAAQSMAKGA